MMPYATLSAWYDALVLDGGSCLWCTTLGGVLYSWMIATHGGFDDLELWLMEAWLG